MSSSMQVAGFKQRILSLSVLCTVFVMQPAMALPSALSDNELREVDAQALLNLSYLAPTDDGSNASTNGNVGFYRLGIEADLELNANIKKLQLGCGGVNGPGACDIDMDNVSLSGLVDPLDREARAASSAVLTNPFIELAMRNPDSASTREMVGLRVSAEKVMGLLTVGTENSDIPNGINTLSGYLPVQSDSSGLLKGIIETAPGYFNAGDPNNRISGVLYGNAPILGRVATAQFHLDQGGFWIPGFENLRFAVPGVTLNGNRISNLPVNPVVSLPDIVLGRDWNNNNCTVGGSNCNAYGASAPGFFGYSSVQAGNKYTYSDGMGGGISSSCINASGASGPCTVGKSQGGVNPINFPGNPSNQAITNSLRAHVDNCSGIGCIVASDSYYVNMYTRVRDVTANVTVNQSLGLVHSIPIDGAPLSLSLQGEALHWPGQPVDDIAQKGWWLSISDPVNLGTIVPTDPVDLCEGGTGNPAKCAYPQIADQVNNYLDSTTLETSDLGSLIFKTNALGIKVGPQGSTGGIGLSPLSLTVDGLVLDNQFFAPNCYGDLTFC